MSDVEQADDQAPESGPAPDAPQDELSTRVEAALLTADGPVTTAKLVEALADDSAESGEGEVDGKKVAAAIEALNAFYDRTARSFRIEEVAGGWRMLTLPRYARVLANLHKTRSQSKLSPAALETLAIIAYQQPILRAKIESIRGVACGEVLRSLLDRRLIRIAGRAEEIGRPMLYGTTRTFLEVFGLSSLKDLPKTEGERKV